MQPDDDVARTLDTYERVADDYRDRHADRTAISGFVEQFCDALPADDAAGSGGADADAAPRVLDVGCGPGWEAATFLDRGFDVTAVDLAPSFLEACAEVAPAAHRARTDMRTLAFREEAFDGLWVMASFLHVPREDADATLRGFRRVLRPGGALFLAVKHGDDDWRPDGTAYGDAEDRLFTMYRPDDIRQRVADAGFTIEERTGGDDWIQVLARA